MFYYMNGRTPDIYTGLHFGSEAPFMSRVGGRPLVIGERYSEPIRSMGEYRKLTNVIVGKNSEV